MEKMSKETTISTVSLVKCSDYNISNVETAIEKAVTTHPAIVRAMIRQVRKAGGIPLVGDCSGYEGKPNQKRYLDACRSSGIMQVCEEEKTQIVHLSAESIEVRNESGRLYKTFILSKQVMDADVLISLPKPKTHGLTLFTGGVKNNFGCITGLNKAKMHLRAQDPETFSQMLVDLLGIDPFMVPSTRLAHEQGMGIGDISNINVVGESLADMQIDDFKFPSGTT